MNHVAGRTGHGNTFTHAQIKRRVHADGQPSQPVEKTELAAVARKQRYAGLRGKCCGTRVRGSVPQPQSSSLALPCQILVSVDGCQSLAAFGSCIHWMRAPSRRPITPAGTVGKRVPGGHNRRRRLATRRCDTKRAGTTAVVPAACRKTPSWPPLPANSAALVCGESAAAQGLGALPL